MAKGDKLTDKQQMFVREYLIDLNATQACIRAGYSPKTADRIGPELLGKTCVQQAIAKANQKRVEKLELSAEWVLQRLKDISDRCMQAEPVLIRDGSDWIESGEYKFDSAGANKATELIGKHLKLFTDKHEVSGPNGQPIQFENKTDLSKLTAEELIQLEQLVTKTAESGAD